MKYIYLFVRNVILTALVPVAAALALALSVVALAASLLAACIAAPVAIVFGWWWVWTGVTSLNAEFKDGVLKAAVKRKEKREAERENPPKSALPPGRKA